MIDLYVHVHGRRNGGCVGCDRTPLSTKKPNKKTKQKQKVRNSITK